MGSPQTAAAEYTSNAVFPALQSGSGSKDCYLPNTDFAGANLTKGSFVSANLHGADMAFGDLRCAGFTGGVGLP